MTESETSLIRTFAAKKFHCTKEELEDFVKKSYKENSGLVACKRGEHTITDEKVYYFGGSKYNRDDGYCSDVECFLTSLGADTLLVVSGKDTPKCTTCGATGEAVTACRKLGHVIENKTSKKTKEREQQPSHTEYADSIMKMNKFLTLKDTEEVLHYENGIYKYGGEVIIKELAESMVEDCTTSMRNEIINSVRARTYVDREIFDIDPYMINVKNGIYNIKSGEFIDHDPAIPSRTQLEAKYDPDANCPLFEKFMGEILDENDRITIYELFGTALLKNALNLEKVMMFIGEGSNGKSTLLRTMATVFGKDNTAHVSIHDLIYQRFSRAVLDGKMINIYADISSDELDKVKAVKLLVTGDPITVEKKNKEPFTLESYAKMFFSCNRLPEIGEDTDAVFRRFIIVNFIHQFRGGKDVKLYEKLTAESEKSGILNLLLEHAKQIMVKGVLTYDPTIESVKREWKGKADPIQNFVEKFLEFSTKDVIPKNIMYEKYTNFCIKNTDIPKSAKGFTERMSKMGYLWKAHKYEGKTINCWIGVKFKGIDSTEEVTTDPTDGTSGENGIIVEKSIDGVNSSGGISVVVEKDASVGDSGEGKKDMGPSSIMFQAIYDEMVKSGMKCGDEDIVKEAIKSDKFDEESAKKHLGGLKRVVKEGWFRCDTCNAGPWRYGKKSSGGRPAEYYHRDHKLEDVEIE